MVRLNQIDPFWGTVESQPECIAFRLVMKAGSANRVRGFGESHNEQPSARRAIVESPAKSTNPFTAARHHFGRLGPAERQLAYSYLITGAVVLFVTVLVPELLALVRNF